MLNQLIMVGKITSIVKSAEALLVVIEQDGVFIGFKIEGEILKKIKETTLKVGDNIGIKGILKGGKDKSNPTMFIQVDKVTYLSSEKGGE